MAYGYEMPCFHPLPAWRTKNGTIVLTKEQKDSTYMRLPCGQCLGCRRAHARAWALRCHLELQQHASAVFTTLTYDDKHLPPTLQKRHLQLWLKRLRRSTDRTIRFFASGEYGTQTHRPHYHAILYGLDERDADRITHTWPHGFTTTTNCTPDRIAYTAGYTDKKIGWKQRMVVEQVDPETGEVYNWQPPFIQMSRQPGIGSHARQWPQSWRLYAIHNGTQMPVPRYLHEAWKQQATEQQKEELIDEKTKIALTRDTTKERLKAQEQIAIKDQSLRAERRKL